MHRWRDLDLIHSLLIHAVNVFKISPLNRALFAVLVSIITLSSTNIYAVTLVRNWFLNKQPMLGLQSGIASVFRSFRVRLGARVGSLRTSSFSLLAATTRTELPEGISLQVLNQNHDLFQVKNLLAKAFVTNNEPIVQALGEVHYPSLLTSERISMVEHRLNRNLFSELTLMEKVKQGLSIVAVKDNDPSQVVSVLFSEKYDNVIYKSYSLIDDPLCETGVNLMYAVHEKALPALESIDPNDIIFISHGATHPKYQSLGIMEQTSAMSFVFLREKGIKVAYFITTAERLSKFIISRYGAQVVAEVFYKDYQVNGKRVFAKLAQKEVSAKALICNLQQ